MSELQTRVVVGIALIAAAAGALWLGGHAFWLVAVVAALLMMGEWADLQGATPKHKRLAQYALSVPLALLSPLADAPPFFELGVLAAAAFFTVIVTRNPRLAAGTLYCGIPAFALVLLRDQGIVPTLWAMGLVWATDIGAYFAGRAIGGPKLAPAVSPNKTWAGLIGGVIAAGLFGLALTHWGLPLLFAEASCVLAILAQIGDLYESALKRRAGVKDSGTILPGHGGVLDRLDGLVPVAPAAALLVVMAGAVS